MNIFLKTTLFGAALTLAMLAPRADAYVRPNLAVQPLAATANDAEDLLLVAAENGSTYLYVEQKQGAQLAVFDVSDPAHIRLDAAVPTGAQGSYDFVRRVGDKELAVFRDGSGSAVIDLHRAKAPRLTRVEGTAAMPTEELGTSGYLASDFASARPARIATAPRVVQVVETTTEAPRVLSTVADVTRQVTRRETGTTFLLGREGVTVVRQVPVERQYIEQQTLWNSSN
jgi:hypothetical protein